MEELHSVPPLGLPGRGGRLRGNSGDASVGHCHRRRPPMQEQVLPLLHLFHPDLSGPVVEGTPQPVVARDSGLGFKPLEMKPSTRRQTPSGFQIRPLPYLGQGGIRKAPCEASVGDLA
eukprot:753537-Amphidinium_carterae.1